MLATPFGPAGNEAQARRSNAVLAPLPFVFWFVLQDVVPPGNIRIDNGERIEQGEANLTPLPTAETH